MDYKFTLRRFFVLVFLFVICPIVGWIAYAHRYNAPANSFFSNEKDTIIPNSVTIPDNELDAATPFYQNKAAEALEKEEGRPTASDAEDKYFSGEIKSGENAKATEAPKAETPADTSKKETK